MELGDVLKTEVLDKLKDIAREQMSAAQKKRAEKYEKDYFKTTDEMVDYMRGGGKIVPTVSSACYQEGFSMKEDNIVENMEIIYSEAGFPLCVQKTTCTVGEFKNKPCFKYKDEGYIMYWKRGS